MGERKNNVSRITNYELGEENTFMKNIAMSVLYTMIVGLVTVAPVYADGEVVTEKVCHTQYGGGVICEEPTPEEAPIAETNTGVVENVILAGTLFAAGYVMLMAAQRFSQVR